MKKFTALYCFCLCLLPILSAQNKHDYVWPIGYGHIFTHPTTGDQFGGVVMDFNDSPTSLTLVDYVADRPRAAISDKEGRLVAYTDGCRVLNREHQVMLNGDTLNPGKVFIEFCEVSSYPIWQCAIFLPAPGSDSLYYLFHLRDDDKSWNPMNLLYTVIDAAGDGGMGSVVEKNTELISDSLHLGNYVTATRHANGRDWWIAVPRRFKNEIHLSLLTPDGAQYMGMQDVPLPKVDSAFWGSQTAFSPDGSKYFRNSHLGLLMLDFDRCNGTLSNPVYLSWDSLPFGGGGVAVSPNNRFLYLSSGNEVFQYDLWAPNLAASVQLVAAYDGTLAPFPTTFFQMMPGPDGRIYICTSYSNNVWHVIEHPNEPGIACKVRQHVIALPALSNKFVPNFANYRLGPLDGSPCDTLGIDNPPIAHFRYDVADTLSPLQLEFTDLSYHEPTTWLWDFGDGSTSQDTSPVHQYSAPGTYQVCLTVCNANTCDTECQTVEITAVSAVTLQGAGGQVLLWPNPARETLHLQSEKDIERVSIIDATGVEILQQAAIGMGTQASVDIRRLSPGLYYIYLLADGRLWSGKFVKI